VTSKDLSVSLSTRGDYPAWLKQEFNERCRINPLYSMRAFARDLKLSPASMSYIMSGQKGLSHSSAKRVAKAIELNDHETEVFCALVQLRGRNKASRAVAHAKLVQLHFYRDAVKLKLDVFQNISDWYHFAILQLVQIKNAQTDSKWMANQLGIHVFEVDAAIERLKRLELLFVEDDRYRVTKEMVFAPDGVPNDAIRKFHRQILDRAVESVSSQTVDERYLNSTVLPIQLKDLPRAREKIKRFHREFDAEFTPATHGQGDHVYALAVQFFTLTPKLK